MSDIKDIEQAVAAVHRIWESMGPIILTVIRYNEKRTYATAEEVVEYCLERKEIFGTPEDIKLLRKLFLEHGFRGTVDLVIQYMPCKKYD